MELHQMVCGAARSEPNAAQDSEWQRRNAHCRKDEWQVQSRLHGSKMLFSFSLMFPSLTGPDWKHLSCANRREKRLLGPVWGRMFCDANLGFRGSSIVKSGPAIFLEACGVGDIIDWPTSLDSEDAAELDRLRLDGHDVSRVGKKHLVSPSLDAVRATQLYRTLLHEIGHWRDWLEKVEMPSDQGEDYSTLYDRYFARPKSEREAFAHRYADNLRATLEKKGVIPFPRIEA